jgi:uncharacterized protein YdaU (DUF1376 family)
VNYYRRYIADYGSKTKALTMVEDGAYTRLLDWYYEHEGPIPEDRAMTIARAMDAGEKKAVRHVLEGHFILRAGHWHNARADEELGIALPKLENLRKVAKENGILGGNPLKKAQYNEPGLLYAIRLDVERVKVGITKYLAQRVSSARKKYRAPEASVLHVVKVVDMGRAEGSLLEVFSSMAKGEVLFGVEDAALIRTMNSLGADSTPNRGADTHPDPGADSSPSSQPLNPSTKPNTAFPVVDTPRQPEAKSAGEAQGDPNPEVQRRRPGMLNLLRKHRVTGAEEHPLIVDRILATAKDEHIVAAFGEAARSKGGQPYDIGFLDAIVARISKADREASERVRGAADARVAETARRAEEQRAWENTPMPDHVRAQLPRKAAEA